MNVKDQAWTLPCYRVLSDAWTMLVSSDMYSFRCAFDYYKLVHLLCVSQMRFISCDLLKFSWTLGSSNIIILNSIVWSFMWCLYELRLIHPLFIKSSVQSDAFISDWLFCASFFILKISLWIFPSFQ